MLQAPGESPYDLRFQLFRFAVRISWTFWLASAALGYEWARMFHYSFANGPYAPSTFAFLFIWIAAMFISILVHELGHTLAFRYFGLDSHIVLYHFGGLAIPEGFASWRGARMRSLKPAEQLVVSLAGPFAQITLGVSLAAAGLAMGYMLSPEVDYWLSFVGISIPESYRVPTNPLVFAFGTALIGPSIWWALLNLVPIFPLDGGQVLQSLAAMYRRTDGLSEAYLVGGVCGILLGLYFMNNSQPMFGMMLIVLGISNIQSLQARRMGGPW